MLSLRNLAPRLGVPVLESFCSEVVWGPKIFPLGPQNRRPVRSSRHVLIERKHSSDARGAWLCCLLIRARKVAALGCVVALASANRIDPARAHNLNYTYMGYVP